MKKMYAIQQILSIKYLALNKTFELENSQKEANNCSNFCKKRQDNAMHLVKDITL